MPEIGPSLREARMRAKIDITEVEQATKIRAKYLRALENEEWSLLPGPTFIKSFLREYADYLGLDARLLVEEYKLRYERPSEQELAPISPNLGRDRRGGGGGGGGGGIRGGGIAPRWIITGVLLLILVGALWAVGSLGGNGKDDAPATTATQPAQAPKRKPATAPHARKTPKSVKLQLVPTGTVYVCLVDENGKLLIPGTTFEAGQQIPVKRARSMKITLGNNEIQMHVNGKSVPVPASSAAIAYQLTPKGPQTIPADAAPTCT